jgi:threonyl-tRNA synthetase
MANPQLEHGYTRVCNELLWAIIKYITNPTWIRIVLLTIRITYGFHRKETVTNYKSFVKILNLTEEYLKSTLLEMDTQKIIFYEPKDSFKFKIALNKNYEDWKISK